MRYAPSSPDQHRQRKTQRGVDLFQPEQNTGVESERVKGSRAEEDSKALKAMVVWGLSEEPGLLYAFINTETLEQRPTPPVWACGPDNYSHTFPAGAPHGRPYCRWCQSCRC